MNYFELFEIPVQLKLESKSLGEKFFQLSRKFHPDYFVGKEEMEQTEALEKSALLNKAYRTFQNPDETIKYVLQLKGLLEEEEKYELPPDFLMEVLDINEQIMDAGDDPELKNRLRHQVDNLQSEIYEPVKKIVEYYQEGATSEKELLQVKEYYYKKKYLLRIKKQLSV
ncbi:MAG: Fe-S protein assembly co-chaperone HscB [Bacteroidetes bacterium]|nr:Fe-S protein assembly co-chaperone HscB [Bacteroidota bacterium]MBS1930135.1 Fe-S protein assembly co-chaperone HscB [Bacteroidota bacterium]